MSDDVKLYRKRSGRLVKEDGTIVNQGDVIEDLQGKIDSLEGKDYATQSELENIKSELETIKSNQTNGEQLVKQSGSIVEVIEVRDRTITATARYADGFNPEKYSDYDFRITNNLDVAVRVGFGFSGTDRIDVIDESGEKITYGDTGVYHYVPAGSDRIYLSHTIIKGGIINTNNPFKSIKTTARIVYMADSSPSEDGQFLIELIGVG